MNERCDRMCAMYRANVPVGEIAACMDVQRPAVWKALRRGGVLPPYQPSVPGKGGRPRGGGDAGYSNRRVQRSLEAAARHQPPPESQFVNRDPCLFCGVRADYGCAHSGKLLSMGAFA